MHTTFTKKNVFNFLSFLYIQVRFYFAFNVSNLSNKSHLKLIKLDLITRNVSNSSYLLVDFMS
jgi:hypothetical protein